MDSSTSTSKVSRIIPLILRVVVFVFLLIALMLIVINKNKDTHAMFNYTHAYRYMGLTIVIGFAYNILQMGLSIFRVVSGKHAFSSDAGYLFDFFGDKIISYILISGSAAGFGASKDLHTFFKSLGLPFNPFYGMANVSAGLLLMGFLFTAIASIFSSFALPKKA